MPDDVPFGGGMADGGGRGIDLPMGSQGYTGGSGVAAARLLRPRSSAARRASHDNVSAVGSGLATAQADAVVRDADVHILERRWARQVEVRYDTINEIWSKGPDPAGAPSIGAPAAAAHCATFGLVEPSMQRCAPQSAENFVRVQLGSPAGV